MYKDKLHEESRNIRKLIDSGKTIEEICEEMQLTKAQIEYRIRTRYSKGIATKILKTLKQNEEKKCVDTEEVLNNESKLLVFDTSALNAIDFFSVISEYDIILTDIVRKEMEKYKREKNVFGANIRKLFKKIAEDVDGRILTAIIDGIKEDGNDEKIVAYCKRVNATLYTSDNSQASYAKIQQVPYILANRDEKVRIGTHALDRVKLQNKSLILEIPNSNRVHYIVIRDGKKLDLNYTTKVELKKEDIILILTYKKKMDGLGISQYTIENITQEDHASFNHCYRGVNSKQEIEILDFGSDVKREIENFLKGITQLKKVL